MENLQTAMKGIEGGANGVNNSSSNYNGNGEQNALRKGPWMPEEDEILVEYVRQYGPRDWSSIRTKGLLPRTGKSCRLRWVNKLKPDLKSGCKFSPEEEKLVVEMQAKLGNKWAKIASYLPGRTDNDVKNFWSTRQKRIMRALQRPKPNSGDSMDVSKAPPSLSHFSILEVEAPMPLQAIPLGHPFPDELNQPPNEMEDILMIKLQDLVAGDSLLMDTDLIPPLVSDNNSPGSAMSSTISHNNSHTPKSPKPKRKRPPKDHAADPSLSKKQHKATAASHYHGLESGHGLGVDLYIDPNDSNILDFLLQTETEGVMSHKNGDFSTPHLGVLSDDIQMSECLNVKEEDDSSTPDSVLAFFPTDVFDSLEPLTLSPTAADWWDSRSV